MPGPAALLLALALALALATSSALLAATAEPRRATAAGMAPQQWQVQRHATIAGRRIDYTATAELLPVSAGADGAADATFFVTSYVAEARRGQPARPVIFAFNGGPGSSSIWLHMKLLGPREVRLGGGGDLAPRTTLPVSLTDNADSPLDVADVVLIDPPGTGYARLLPGTDPARYYGVTADAVAVARVIEHWIDRHGRWNAPKYLLGESYGTVRAAVVADILAGGGATGRMDGIALNGIVLIGQALDMAAAGHGDRSYLAGVPAQAATAWYYRKASTGLPSAAAAEAKADAFVRAVYLPALFAGDRLAAEERQQVATGLASLTGLPVDLIQRNGLRVSSATFAANLLADRRLALSPYDTRMSLAGGGDPDNLADDPSMGQIAPGFVAGFGDYLRNELGVTAALPYIAIDFANVNSVWDYGNGKGIGATTGFASHLAAAMRRNPGLRLLVIAGRYDLVTPAAEARYVVAHADLPRDRTSILETDAGHMPYLGPARPELAQALRAFVSIR